MKIFTKIVNNTSVHILTPVFFVIIILFLVMQTYLIKIPQAIEEEDFKSKKELLGVVAHSQITINNLLDTKNNSYILQELELLHLHNKRIKFAVIFDANMQVKYITNTQYSEHALNSIKFLMSEQVTTHDKIFVKPYIYHGEVPYQLHAISRINLADQQGYLFIEYDFHEDIEYIKTIITNLFAISLAVVLTFFMFFGLFIYLFFLKKVDLLRKASDKLKQGSYGFQLKSDGFKEIKEIIDSFNQVSLKIADDINKLEQTKQAFNYEKNTAQNYLDIVDVMILVLDVKYNVTMINRRGCEILGCQMEEVIGRNWIENFLPERFRDEVVNVGHSLTKIKENERIEHFENPILKKNGEERLIAWRNSTLYNKEGKVVGILTSGEDITDARKAQLRIAESESFYRNIFSSVQEAIIILENNVVVDCNSDALKLFDTTKENLIGINIVDEIELVQCKGIDLHDSMTSVLEGNIVKSECSISTNKLEFSKIAEMTFSPLAKDDGRVICVARDMTKKLEQEKFFSMHARQAQMGEMISMIAHQWRQPLASISAITTQMVFQQLVNNPGEKETVESLNKIEQQVTHLSQTISDFRDFFRPDKPKEYIKLSQIVNHAVELLDNTIKSHAIEIKQVIHNDSEVKTYRNELTQVLMTMIKNAIDAFEDNNIQNKEVKFILDQTQTHAQIQIKDNAGGIHPSVMKDIFLPYFSTKNRENGTGLGLYMSRTIIEDNCRGELHVQSEDEITLFTILLPLNEEEV